MTKVSSSNGLEKCPKLRFSGFNDSWNESPLAVYFEKNVTKNTNGSITNVICNSAKRGLIPQQEYFDKSITNSNNLNGYYIIKPNDFVYNPRKSSDAPYGPINRYTYVKEGIVSPLYLCFRAKKNIDINFFDWYFRSTGWYRYIYKFGDSGARHDRVSIKDDDFFSMPICFPSETEQNKIADFLNKIEKRITTQQFLVNSLKKYKRGVMQHIFSRTPPQTIKEWTCIRLGDVFKKVSRRNTNGLVKNVITNSAEYGLIPQRDFFDKDIAVDGNTANYYVIEKGDFVYNPRKSNTAPYGPFNRYTLDEKGIISPLYTCLVLKADICPSYLAWYFRSDAWHRYIYDNGSQGVRHDRVSMTDKLLMGIPVIFPDQAKQQEYADILDKVEARLQAAQKIYELLIKTKCGYMQQLFI